MIPEIPDDIERQCIWLKIHKTVIYLYPFDANIAATHCKVFTRDGKVVRNVHWEERGDFTIVVGHIDGQTYQWDEAGRYVSPYVDNTMDLFIPERYFDPRWKDRIKLSNAEWYVQFGRKHPYCPDAPSMKYELYRLAEKKIEEQQKEEIPI